MNLPDKECSEEAGLPNISSYLRRRSIKRQVLRRTITGTLIIFLKSFVGRDTIKDTIDKVNKNADNN